MQPIMVGTSSKNIKSICICFTTYERETRDNNLAQKKGRETRPFII